MCNVSYGCLQAGVYNDHWFLHSLSVKLFDPVQSNFAIGPALD